MKSSVFLHVFNDISTYAYVLTEYFLHSFSNLSIEFHLVLLRMQYFSCGSDKYSEIKMCDLEPFSKIRSHIIVTTFNLPTKQIHINYTTQMLEHHGASLS